MFARLLLTVVVVAFGSAAATVEEASAYRSTPNPATVELNWPSAYGKLRASSDFFTCETGTYSCTPAQRSGIAKARQAVSALPKLRALTSIVLYTTAFEVGWSIGRTIDTKWLHLSGSIGTINATWTVGTWIYSSTQLEWQHMLGAPGSGLSQRIPVPWPRNPSTGVIGSPCTGAGNGDWIDANHCGSQWATWRAYQLRQEEVALAVPTSAIEVDSSASHCGQGVGVGVCLMVTVAESAMEEAVGADGQLLGANPVPARSPLTTNIAAPSATPPAWGSAVQIAATAALVEDEAEAQAAAGTAAEEDTIAFEAGSAVDPAWEGYPLPEFVMPNCVGLTVAACTSALEAAGHVGTIEELELDIATADVTRPAGAVVATSPGAATSWEADTPVELQVNPDPLPLELPEPNLGETYTDYIERLQALGYVGTATIVTLTEAAGDPALGPDAPVTVSTPQIETQTPTVIRVGLPWPSPAPRIYPDTNITVHVNPPTYAPVPTPGGPASGPLTPTGIDFTPITDIDFGCKFPYGLISCYALGVTEWFAVSPNAPVFDFDLSSIGSGAPGGPYDLGAYVVDLEVMDDYMSLLRTLMSVALWIGTVYYLAAKLLNFNAGGDPGEAVDEGLDWS